MINTLLYLIFLYVPDFVLYFFITLVAYLKSFYRIFANFNMEVKLYKGYRNNHPVQMLWIGTDEMKEYILERLYDSAYQVTRLKSTNFLNLRRTLDSLSAQSDLIYVEINSLLPQLKGFKRITQYVLTRMKLEERSRKKYKEAMQIIKKNSVEFKEFKISQNVDQFRLFYDQLYAPYISSRWGEHRVESFDSLKRYYAKGGLLLAYHKGEAIAGSVLLFQSDTLVKCKYGIRNAKDKLHRAAASYYSSSKYAKEHKFAYFSDFHVRPFMNDGLFRYKREWGLNVSIEKRNYYFDKNLYCKVINYNPGVADFLSKEPFIFVLDERLVASLLCSDETSTLVDEIVRQYQRVRTGGIAQYEFSVMREITNDEEREIYRRSGVSEEENVLKFSNYSITQQRMEGQE